MNIGERKIGHDGDKKIDVVNLKCAPEVIESLAGIEPGIYRDDFARLGATKDAKIYCCKACKTGFLIAAYE